MFRPLKITFHLDYAGIIYDPSEPIHLDGLLAAAYARHHHAILGGTPSRDEPPTEIPMPLAKWTIGEHWGWRASALLVDEETLPIEEIRYWRKRLRVGHIEVSSGSPNTKMGCYRDWQSPLRVILVPRLIGYAVGNARKIRHDLLRFVKSLGRKRGLGYGKVVAIDVQEVDRDYSCVKNGYATRYLPVADGERLVRTRPPYWNSHSRIACCSVGDKLPEDVIQQINPWHNGDAQ